MGERFESAMAHWESDQIELNDRGIDLEVKDVVTLSMYDFNTRINNMNLTNKDMIFIKKLRRKIRNRVSSQKARQRTKDRIICLKKEITAVKACKSDILKEWNLWEERHSLWRNKTMELYEYIDDYLSSKNDETEMPFDPNVFAKTEKSRFKELNKDLFERMETDQSDEPSTEPCEKLKNINCHVVEMCHVSCENGGNIESRPVECENDRNKTNEYPLIKQLLQADPIKSGVCKEDCFMSDEKMDAIIKMESEILNLAVCNTRSSKKRKQSRPRRVIKDFNCIEELAEQFVLKQEIYDS